MTDARCTTPLDDGQFLAYWLGELPGPAEAQVEAHLFACATCTRHFDALARLASGIRTAVREGTVHAVITQAFLDGMKRAGMRIREYHVRPGERVACTLGAHDDAVVSRLGVPLAGVTRVDIVESLDLGDGEVQTRRMADVPFEPAAGEMLALPSAAVLRTLPAHTLRVCLVAVEAAGERTLGEYTFAHTPG